MKRLFILLLCLFCLFLSSCGERDYGFLPFENKNVKAECEVNGKFTVIIDKTQNECSLTVVSPSEISGLKFTFSEDGDFIIADGMKLPFDRYQLKGIYALSSLFDIKEEAMISAVSKEGHGNITFENGGTEYLLIFDNDGYLRNAEISGEGYDYAVKILSLYAE